MLSTDTAPEPLQEGELALLPGSLARSWMSWENLALKPAACHVPEDELGSKLMLGKACTHITHKPVP